MNIIVDNRIRIPTDALPATVVSELKSECEHSNPEFHTKQAIGVPTFNVPRTIRTWRIENDELTLPRGAMKRVRASLKKAGIAYKVLDRRIEGEPCASFPKYVGPPIRYYQREAIERALRHEQCILRAPTGSGKTLTCFALLAEIGLNALVILPTGGLFKQWIARAERELGIHGSDLGVIRGKVKRLRPVTIAMQRTLANGISKDVKEFFGVIVVDEAQLAAARTYIEVIDQFPARYRVAVSADERRKDRKEFLAYDLFSDVAHEVKRDVLEDEGHVAEVQIRVIPTEFRADWYGMPDEEKEIDFNRLIGEMIADETRNKLALDVANAELKNGEQVIMFTARRDHVQKLDRYFVERQIPSGYFLGKEERGDDIEFDRTSKGILNGSVRIGIGTYQALGFGIDLPAVSAGVAVTPIASNDQQFNQVRGRLARPAPGKANGRFYVLWDQHVYPKHLLRIMAKNKDVVVRENGKWIPAKDSRSYSRVRF